MNFKAGDWIRVPKYKHIFQFTSTFEEDGIEYIADGYDDIYGQQGWTIDEVEPWQPQAGEWCWYKHLLVKVLNIDKKEDGIINYKVSAPMYAEQYSGAISLEPFTNTLPPFIKDEQCMNT